LMSPSRVGYLSGAAAQLHQGLSAKMEVLSRRFARSFGHAVALGQQPHSSQKKA